MKSMPSADQLKWELYKLHKAFGIITLILVCIRLAIRLKSLVPALPSEISKLDAQTSKIAKIFMYVCMFIIPFSGYIASTASGREVHVFFFKMPSFFSEINGNLASAAMDVHGLIAYSLIVLISLHLLGVVKHIIFDKVNLLKRII
jgi:cytochrome b561